MPTEAKRTLGSLELYREHESPDVDAKHRSLISWVLLGRALLTAEVSLQLLPVCAALFGL